MLPFHTLVLCALIRGSWGIDPSFPPYFTFGAATAAYQVEGGWNDDGKGENIWDRYVHEHPEDIWSNATGDTAADSYHRWREDVKAAVQMGLQTYRFSINWARILPTGFTNRINKAGVKFYSDLIDSLLAEGIQPVVTLYHWDLPVKIQDLGGWTNPLIVKWFGDYARVVFALYSDRVRTWLTINEPVAVCDYFNNLGLFAPRIKEPELAPFLCNKYIMLAHAQAYRIFEKEFKPKYPGRVSIANNVLWIEPLGPNDNDLAELGRQYQIGRYSHPIFSKQGGWPPSVEKYMLELSLKQGYTESRLPTFTQNEIQFIKGTADFYGINYYTTMTIRPARRDDEPAVWFINGSPELNATLTPVPGAVFGASPILPIAPKGLRKVLSWLKQQYGDIDILITENGYSSKGYQLNDYDRADYIKKHLEQVLLAIKVDDVNVIGYTVWTLIDNFEWLDGYRTKFGLYEIDFEHPNRTRTARVSARYYTCVVSARSLLVPDSCHNKNFYAVHRIRRTDENNGGTCSKCDILLSLCAVSISVMLSRLWF